MLPAVGMILVSLVAYLSSFALSYPTISSWLPTPHSLEEPQQLKARFVSSGPKLMDPTDLPPRGLGASFAFALSFAFPEPTGRPRFFAGLAGATAVDFVAAAEALTGGGVGGRERNGTPGGCKGGGPDRMLRWVFPVKPLPMEEAGGSSSSLSG